MSSAGSQSLIRNTVGLMFISKVKYKYALILLIIMLPNFLLADPWHIDQDNNFVNLKKNGEIQHGNNIYFSFSVDNGCKFDVFFLIHTMQDIQKPLQEIYKNQSLDLNFGGLSISGHLNYSFEFGLGQIASVYVARGLPLSKEFIILNNQMLKNYFMTMSIEKEEHLPYFDIPEEKWDFTNIEAHLYEAQSMCIASLA